MCSATPASRATWATPCMVASGQTVPKPPLDVFSIETSRERGALRLLGSRRAAFTCSPVNTPFGPSIARIMTPELAAGPPVSALMMWAVRSAITSSPSRQWTRMAIWLAMVPLGRKTASSLPRSSQTRSRSRLTVGSSIFCSSPTSASAMAFRMPGEGLVLVSL